MTKKILVIITILVVICSLVYITQNTINYKHKGYFEAEDYVVNDSNIKITQEKADEIIVYSDKLEIVVPNIKTRIGWNKKILIIEHENIFTIINIEEEKIIEELTQKEFKEKRKNSEIKKIKLKTIGRYVSQTYHQS